MSQNVAPSGKTHEPNFWIPPQPYGLQSASYASTLKNHESKTNDWNEYENWTNYITPQRIVDYATSARAAGLLSSAQFAKRGEAE